MHINATVQKKKETFIFIFFSFAFYLLFFYQLINLFQQIFFFLQDRLIPIIYRFENLFFFLIVKEDEARN